MKWLLMSWVLVHDLKCEALVCSIKLAICPVNPIACHCSEHVFMNVKDKRWDYYYHDCHLYDQYYSYRIIGQVWVIR